MKNLILPTLVIIALFNAFLSNATAKNCGIIGVVYPIAETDLRQVIQQRLALLQQNGELARWQEQWRQNVARQFDRPTPLDLPRTITPVTHAVNSELPAGAFTETFIFYNGDDPAQVRWAQKTLPLFKTAKVILTGGSVSEQQKMLQKKVYFDQGAHLVTQLGIHHVPALVFQQDDHLTIAEVTP